MVDLDTMLREALAEDADLAPELPDTWTGPTVATRALAPSPRLSRRRLGGVILVSAVAAATIGLFVVVDRGDDPQGEVEPADAGGWTPPGVEFPLEDLGVPESNFLWITVAGLSRSLGVGGHPPLVIATTLRYAGGATAELQRCLSSQGGGAGCAPEWARDGIDVGMTASGNLWTWANVPAGAAYVTYVDGPQVRWQRPVAGVAAFPNVAGNDEVAIAYTSNGTELARVDFATVMAVNRRLEAPPRADITQAQYEELVELTDTTLGDCLTDNGARLDASNVAVLPADVDDVEVWDQCVAVVKQVVAERVDELNVSFYDSVTQLPTASHPALQFDEPAATDKPN